MLLHIHIWSDFCHLNLFLVWLFPCNVCHFVQRAKSRLAKEENTGSLCNLIFATGSQTSDSQLPGLTAHGARCEGDGKEFAWEGQHGRIVFIINTVHLVVFLYFGIFWKRMCMRRSLWHDSVNHQYSTASSFNTFKCWPALHWKKNRRDITHLHVLTFEDTVWKANVNSWAVLQRTEEEKN